MEKFPYTRVILLTKGELQYRKYKSFSNLIVVNTNIYTTMTVKYISGMCMLCHMFTLVLFDHKVAPRPTYFEQAYPSNEVDPKRTL
jgi:hypothetical protein